MAVIRVSFTVRQVRKICKVMGVRKLKNEDDLDYEYRKIGAESYVAERLFLMGIEKLIKSPVEYTRSYTTADKRIHTFYKDSKKYIELYGEDDSEGKVEIKVKDKSTRKSKIKVKYKKESEVLIESEDEIIDFVMKIYIGKNDKGPEGKKLSEVGKQEALEWICTRIVRYEAGLLIEKNQEDESIRSVLHSKKLHKLSDEIDFSKIKTGTIYEEVRRLTDSNRSRDTKREVSRRIRDKYPLLNERRSYLEDKIKQVYISTPQNLSSTESYINYVYEECLKQLIEEKLVNSSK